MRPARPQLGGFSFTLRQTQAQAYKQAEAGRRYHAACSMITVTAQARTCYPSPLNMALDIAEHSIVYGIA